MSVLPIRLSLLGPTSKGAGLTACGSVVRTCIGAKLPMRSHSDEDPGPPL